MREDTTALSDGPIVDPLLHSPCIGAANIAPRADDVPWTDDPRLRRVMHTVSHPTEPGVTVGRLNLPAVSAVPGTPAFSPPDAAACRRRWR